MTSQFSTVLEEFSTGQGARIPPHAGFDIKRLIALRTPLMLIVALALAIPGALAGWFLTPITYTATANIQFISNPQPILAAQTSSNVGNYDKFVNTQIELITGNVILERVLDEPGIRQLPSLAASEDPLELLKKRVKARIEGRSELVEVTCTMARREDARTILEAVVDVYRTYALKSDAEATEDRLNLLEKAREDQNRELDGLKVSLASLQERMGLPPSLTGEVDLYNAREIEAGNEETRIKNAIAAAQADIETLDGLSEQSRSEPERPIYDFQIEDQVFADQLVTALQQQLGQAQAQLDEMLLLHREASPGLIAQRRKVASLQTSVGQEMQRVRGEVIGAKRRERGQYIERAKEDLADAQAAIAKYKQKVVAYTLSFDQRAREAALQQSTLDAQMGNIVQTRSHLARLNQQITEIRLEKNAAARVSIASPASVPIGRSRGNQVLAAMGVIALSAFIGLAAGILRELMDREVRSPQDIARVTDHPIIASIPHASEDKALNGVHSYALTSEHPNSTSANEYRRVLSKLLYPEEDSAEVNSLLVVSPTTGDGRTSLVCNLAIALHQANRRVLVLDLNSQRPHVEQCFDLSPSRGLAELLNGECPREDTIHATDFEKLYVVGPGLDADKLAGRLASREMMELLEWADEEFDHTIIDTPPLLLMSDAKLLAPAVDGVLVVVGVGKSELGMVQRCLSNMEQMRANVIGVVLNGIRRIRGGYMGRNLELYYAYFDGQDNGKHDEDLPELRGIGEDAAKIEAPVELLPLGEERDSR